MNKFRLQIILRLFLLTANLFFICLYIFQSALFIVILLSLTSVVQIILFFNYTDRTNKAIIKFLRGINYSDFTQNITVSNSGKSFKELHNELNKVLGNFKKARLEKEESIRYLETVVEHVGIGLISFNSNGDVELINKAAKRILKISHIKNISMLNNLKDDFGTFLIRLKPGTKSIFKIVNNGEVIQLMIYGTGFRMKNENIKLISLYDIQPELEEKEIEAWQKLISVLTHEIINSITPISSLASTAGNIIKNNLSSSQIENETLDDINNALSTIQKRSAGLIGFINKFRDISKIPKPNFQIVKVSELFYRIRLLAESFAEKNKIDFSFEINPEHLEIIADPDLIEHVLINLVKNSIQAMADSTRGKVKISADINERGRAILRVVDNGPGIPAETLEKIFVPFFSTKQDGSGIGLSVSQQIIRAHGGNIWVQSNPNIETVFTIRL